MAQIDYSKNDNKIKLILVLSLFAVSIFLEIYFQLILNISTVFSHFYYIPTILACLWWKKRGLYVPLSLSLILIFFPIIFLIPLPVEQLINDILRAIILSFTGTVVAILSEQNQKAHQALKSKLDELDCLHSIAQLIKNPNLSVHEILEGTISSLKKVWSCPNDACFRIAFDGKTYTSSSYAESPWEISHTESFGDKDLHLRVFIFDEEKYKKSKSDILERIAEELRGIFELKLEFLM